jgi:hypothetical protein
VSGVTPRDLKPSGFGKTAQIEWLIVGKGDFEKVADKLRDFEVVAETPVLRRKPMSIGYCGGLGITNCPDCQFQTQIPRVHAVLKSNRCTRLGPPSKLQ